MLEKSALDNEGDAWHGFLPQTLRSSVNCDYDKEVRRAAQLG